MKNLMIVDENLSEVPNMAIDNLYANKCSKIESFFKLVNECDGYPNPIAEVSDISVKRPHSDYFDKIKKLIKESDWGHQAIIRYHHIVKTIENNPKYWLRFEI